jgi:long-chain acyl-CoA synthetase
LTLVADLLAAAERHPDREAVVDGERRLTFAELAERVEAVAGSLAAAGVRRGDRVAVVMPNGADAAIAIYAAMRAGAAFVPLPHGAKPERLRRLTAHCGARVVLTGLAGLPRGAAPPALPEEDDLASVIYTSGSTGEPKGATFAHRNMTFVAGSIVSYLGLGRDDRILCPLPLAHTYGLYHLIMAVRVGATLVLDPGAALAGRIVGALERERITFLPGVPTTWELLTSRAGAARELPHLRTLTNAGAALGPDQVAAVRATFPGARLFCMYGQTECKRVCYLPPEELDARPGSVGVAIPGTEAWVADDGELMVRGEHVMLGYWDDPAATARKLIVEPDGGRVLRTGDLFRQDADGYLYFVARKDDIIKSRGEKVAPLEVEHVLLRAPGVAEAAVVGAPDRLLGEAVVAHVAGADLDAIALRRHCATQLEAHLVPKEFRLHAALPRTHSGKVDRAALKDLHRAPGRVPSTSSPS